jgi:hypothetical protein
MTVMVIAATLIQKCRSPQALFVSPKRSGILPERGPEGATHMRNPVRAEMPHVTNRAMATHARVYAFALRRFSFNVISCKKIEQAYF